MWSCSEKSPAKYRSQGKIWMIPIVDIQPNPDQPRREFSYEKLLELAQSITENGLLQPISICFVRNKPVLVAGERRLRAAKMAGMKEIPCIEVSASGAQSALLSLIENIQRQDMNCFEEANGIRRLIDIYGLTQDEAAFRLGCSQPTIANKLRLLRLTDEEQHRICEAELTERHARALLRLGNEASRQKVLDRVITYKLNVAQTEKLVEEQLAGKPAKRKLTPLVKDVRIFINTVNHAVETMRKSGIDAQAVKDETDEYIEYTVRIAKSSSARHKTAAAI